MLDNFFDNLNLTSIIGHHTVPEESLDNDAEKLLDNIKNKSEIMEHKESPLKHTAGVAYLK